MAILPTCPSCGLESAETRCPRCNALKVIGCSGSCAMCGATCDAAPAKPGTAQRPSDDAEACGPTGTPLKG